MTVINRSIDEPIREGLSWIELWRSDDAGLIICWEQGRKMRVRFPVLAARATRGELLPLPWKGGVEWPLAEEKEGTLQYLAMWQGLRNQDLHIDLLSRVTLTCVRTSQTVIFKNALYALRVVPPGGELPAP